MLRFIFILSMVLLTFQSYAFSPVEGREVAGPYDMFLVTPQGWGEEDNFSIVEKEDGFCILSNSGGGDSGGGVPGSLLLPKGQDISGGDADDRKSIKRYFPSLSDDDFSEVSMDLLSNHTLNPTISFELADLLDCRNGQTIPYSLREEIQDLLKHMVDAALEEGRFEDVRALVEMSNLLVAAEDV